MATQYSTFPIEFRGGLISNLSDLQHGTNAVGSATILQNLEPSREGGYAKIRGFEKFTSSTVPGTGVVLAVKVISTGRVIAARKVDAAAVTSVTATANVNGATSSTTDLDVDGNSGTIEVGMTVTGSGISGTVTVSTVTDQNNLVLSSAQSLSNDVALTFAHMTSSDLNKTAYYFSTGSSWTFMQHSASTNGGKARHVLFNFDGDDKVIFVDGVNFPAIYNTSGNATTFMTSSNSTDVQGAESVAIFKNSAFYSKGSDLFFTAPFTVDDFSAANGAGSINVANDITGLAVFRDQLIVFTQDTIKRITGSSSADFTMSPVTDKIGCINGDTIQEIGGDVIYLAPDGIRLLSATDRIGDFALDIASDRISKDASTFSGSTSSFTSLVIREKNQYRIFAYIASEQVEAGKGLIATKFISQGAGGLQWATTKGIKANVADSRYSGTIEMVAFAHEDGYVYRMDTGSDFDGESIEAVYESPYMPVTDPQTRKTFYKLTLYAEPTGNMELNLNVKYNNKTDSDTSTIQPPTQQVSGSGTSVFIFGASSAVFGNVTNTATANVNGATTSTTALAVDGNSGTIVAGMGVTGAGIIGVTTVSTVTSQTNLVLSSAQTLANNVALTFHPSTGQVASPTTAATFGGELDSVYTQQIIGSGKTIALRLADNSTNPTFTLDTALLDYRQNDRQ